MICPDCNRRLVKILGGNIDCIYECRKCRNRLITVKDNYYNNKPAYIPENTGPVTVDKQLRCPECKSFAIPVKDAIENTAYKCIGCKLIIIYKKMAK